MSMYVAGFPFTGMYLAYADVNKMLEHTVITLKIFKKPFILIFV